VARCIQQMDGGEVFVPKIPSMSIEDLATAVAPDCQHEYVGIRPGEKLSEVLVSEDEARHTVELDDMFIIHQPSARLNGKWAEARRLPDGFSYASDTNPAWLSVDELRVLAQRVMEHS